MRVRTRVITWNTDRSDAHAHWESAVNQRNVLSCTFFSCYCTVSKFSYTTAHRCYFSFQHERARRYVYFFPVPIHNDARVLHTLHNVFLGCKSKRKINKINIRMANVQGGPGGTQETQVRCQSKKKKIHRYKFVVLFLFISYC